MTNKKLTLKTRSKLLITILVKDLKSELKQIHDFFSIVLFNLISIIIFSVAYNISTQNQTMSLEIFVIEIWIIIFFTLIFIIAKLFLWEKENGTLEGMLSTPLSINMILTSKITICFILLLLIELTLLPFSYFLSNPSNTDFNSVFSSGYIFLGIILPTLDLAVCGAITSALTMYVKKKSFVSSILLFPILIPIIYPIISLNIKLLQGAIISDIFFELLFIIFHTVLMSSILLLVSEQLFYD